MQEDQIDLLTVDEHTSQSYGPRTFFNAAYSDLTVAFACNFNTAGEILTEKASKGKILQFPIDEHFDSMKAARTLYRYVKDHNAKNLNIAGNGLHTFRLYGFDQKQVNKWVYETLKPVHTHFGIERIRSGGQTGADTAGAVAGIVLGIQTRLMYPKGYRQRLEDGMDIIQSQDEAKDTIIRYSEELRKDLSRG